MGPGSPTYAARQLENSLAWNLVRARHRLGATLVFASAATISVGAWVLPVYEIYKAGEDVHAKKGLNLFEDFGLQVSFVPHWNNAEGGADLDTSRCFMGMERFSTWCALLPKENNVIGLDEHTGLTLDLEMGVAEVSGVSSVSLIRECDPEIYPAGAKFAIKELGAFHSPNQMSGAAWESALNAPPLEEETPPAEVLALAKKRLAARERKDFAEADKLREEIAARGWQVQDGREGQNLLKL
jgi:hypothetical protein